MRRFLKPAIAVAAAGAAAVIVSTAGSPFTSAPVARTKTVECRPAPVTPSKAKAKVALVPTLPSIPKAQIPCDVLTNLQDKLTSISVPTPPALQELPARLAEIQQRLVNLVPTTLPPQPVG